ncbi:MAG: glycosyltransferase [Bacilli bacterium]|jgi:glycosyltransferase involved in cell wall biosynthesis
MKYYMHIGSLEYKGKSVYKSQINYISSGQDYFRRLVEKISETKTIFINSVIETDNPRAKPFNEGNYFVSFVSNSLLVRVLQTKWAIIKNYRKMPFQDKSNSEIVILLNQPLRPYLKAAFEIKKDFKKAQIITFIPDLPEYSNLSRLPLFINFLKKIDNSIIYRQLKKIDAYVLFAEAMAKILPKHPYTTIETISEAVLYVKDSQVSSNKKVILYTGSLHSKFSVFDFAFSLLPLMDDNVVFIVAGKGDDCERLSSMPKNKVIALGYLSPEEVIEYQKAADVVVNPRLPDSGLYTNYSFPSKITEYLSNCGIVACHKLGGVPNEYDSVLFYPEEATSLSLAKLCIKLCYLSNADRENARANSSRLLSLKTAEYAVKKLYDLEDLLNNR